MNSANKNLTILAFAVIAATAIILINSGRSGTIDTLDDLESRFIETTLDEQEGLVGRFDENDIKDIEASIAKYEQEILPRIEEEIQTIRQSILNTKAGAVRDIYKQELMKKIREGFQYREALAGYKQLQTWYYENKG